MHPRRLILGGVICYLLLLSSCGQKKTTDQNVADYEAEAPEIVTPFDEEQSAELEGICSQLPQENFQERFESMNPWRKAYFCNEWDEEDYSMPYLYTTLSGSSWDIHIDYHQTPGQTYGGIFRIYIVDDNGYKTSLDSPVTILVRGTDEETKIVDVTGVTDGIIFIEDPATVEGLKEYFNDGQFDILIEFDKYLERHRTKAHWWSDAGFFRHAIDTML